MRIAFLAGLLVLAGSSLASAQCVGGYCYGPGVSVRVMPPPVYAPPPMVYQPQVTYRPLQHQGTVYQPRAWQGPIWAALFGRYRVYHQYGPVQQQNGGNMK